VLECYSGDEEYTELGHLQEWEEVFYRAPVEKIDEQIALKEAQLAEVQAKLRQTESEIRDIEIKAGDRMKLLKRHEGLEYLENILEGRFTHYVVFNDYSYGPEIQELKDTLTTYDNQWSKKLRPLVLRADVATGKVRWELAEYNDGSGSSKSAIPCLSFEDAMEKLSQWLDRKWEEFRKSTYKDGAGYIPLGGTDYAITSAKKYGIPVPEDILKASKDAKLRNINSRMEELKKQDKALQAELAAATAL
jgi:hypothetical protein